jgi:hypothetical protein
LLPDGTGTLFQKPPEPLYTSVLDKHEDVLIVAAGVTESKLTAIRRRKGHVRLSYFV